jgi:hypothetical protein
MAAPVNVRSCAPAAGMAINVANASAVQSFFKLVPALATVIGLQQSRYHCRECGRNSGNKPD